MGALGCLFAAKLAPHANVTVIGHWPDQLATLAREPLRYIDPDGEESQIILNATNNLASVPAADLILILTKSRGTASAAVGAAHILRPDGIAITLQNGLGNLELLSAQIGPERSIQGITTEAAHNGGQPGHVTHAAHGVTYLTTRPESAAQVDAATTLLRDAGLTVTITEDVDALVWGKLVVNAAINPLTALLRVPNGDLLASPHASRWMALIAREVASVAAAQGITLPFSDPAQHVREVARATGRNRSSMLQDVLRGALTEIDVICGAVVRIGTAQGIPTPCNQILFELVSASDEAAAHQQNHH